MTMAKLKSTWYRQRKTAPRDHWLGLTGRALQSYRAVEYARWLAERDNLELSHAPGRVEYSVAPDGTTRPSAVYFGPARVAIPHWDHVERAPVVELED